MSEPFMFRDAPSQPKQADEELQQNAEKPKRKLPATPPVAAAVDDDFEVLVRILGMLQHRTPYSRERILNAIKTILDS